jgi:4-amino-4-deoxy-L-arabinose transferase-like glycosyltransferase
MAGFNDGGEPGLFRMGDAGMSGQISWLLPFALLGLLAWLGRPTWKILDNLNEREILAIGFSLWLVPELVYFSFTSGFYHTYYLVMVAVPLAGLVGISAAMMYEKYREPGIRGFLLPVVILVTGIVQWQFCGYTVEFSGMLSWIILGGSIAAALILLLLGMSDYPATLPAIRAVVVVGTGLLLVAPFIWACTPVMYEGNAALPFAGPGLASENKYSPGPDHGMQGTNTPALYSYLSSHRSGEKYLVGVESAMSGSDLIINYSAPVMAIGGFSGSDSILTVTSLRSLISAGEIRYFWLEQKGFVMPQRGGSNVTSWIRDSCPVVTDGEWIQAEQPPGPRSTLYDCKGVV